MLLLEKTAVVTGGSKGIGMATARRFLAEGARVAITGRDRYALDAAAAQLGGDVITICADVGDLANSDQLAETVHAKWGSIDIFVANAGITGATPIGGTTTDHFEQIIRTNVMGTFFSIQSAAPHLKDGASVILHSSTVALTGNPKYAAYAASKAAIRAMGRVLAAELAPRKIRVNTVTPGAVRTTIWSEVAPTEEAFKAVERRVTSAIPLGQFIEPAEVADVMLFLASDAGRNMTGAELVIDGGLSGAPSGAPIYFR